MPSLEAIRGVYPKDHQGSRMKKAIFLIPVGRNEDVDLLDKLMS